MKKAKSRESVCIYQCGRPGLIVVRWLEIAVRPFSLWLQLHVGCTRDCVCVCVCVCVCACMRACMRMCVCSFNQ